MNFHRDVYIFILFFHISYSYYISFSVYHIISVLLHIFYMILICNSEVQDLNFLRNLSPIIIQHI